MPGPIVTETVWMVTPRLICGRPVNQRHVIRDLVTVCGMPIQPHTWFPPNNPDRSERCVTCWTTLVDEERRRPPEGHSTTREVIALTGLTYRQIDHWTADLGWLKPTNPNPGYGTTRFFPPEEVTVAMEMAKWIRIGLTVRAAHQAARNGGQLAPGVRIVIEEAAA